MMEPHQWPDKPARGIASVGTTELYSGPGQEPRANCVYRKIRFRNKVEALEKLMRHLGLLEKDRSAVNVQLLEKEYSGVAVQAICKGYVKRIRFHSKNDALQKLMTHLGLLETDHSGVAVQVNSQNDLKVGHNNDQPRLPS